MPELNSELLRKIWPIIFVVSTTKDLESAERIQDSISGLVSIMKEKEEENPDCKIGIATYVFGEEIEFCSSGLILLDDFDNITFNNIKSENCSIDFTKLLNKLNDDFSRKKLFSNGVGYYAPTIVFLLDGENDYLYSGLECIKKNKWFKCSKRVAVVYNDYSKNYNTILELIGNNLECFIKMSDTHILKELIMPTSVSINTCGVMPERFDVADIFEDELFTKEEDTTNYKQVIAVPSNDKIHISGTYNLKKCQVSVCEPDKANNDIVIIETLHNGINVRNVSDMTLYTVRGVRSHDTRCFDYELGKRFLLDARKDAFVSFDFNQDGNLITIDNMSDNDIDFIVELNEKPHFMQTDDMILDINGDDVLMVVDENDSAETNIEWSENDFDDGGWD